MSAIRAAPPFRFQYDDFGRVTAKWDLGSVRTDFDYDGTGALDYQQSGHGQRLDYQYDAGGNLAAILDQAENRQAYYGYDAAGRRWRERMYVNGVLHQDAQTTFDSAGRIQQVSDLRYRLNYRYDAHGNRTLIHAVYLNHELASKTDVLLYKYDEMNRVTLSQGVYNSESGTIGATPNQGIVLGYDDLGQRTSASGPGDNGQYYYDGAGRLREIWAGATRLERREYDGASRMKYQVKYTGTPADPANRTEYIYDDDGRLVAQEVRFNADGSGPRKSRTDFYLDAAGTQTGYYMQTFRNSSGVESVWEWYQYANQYKAADTYLLTVQQVNIQFRQEDGDPDRAYGSLERVYDANNDVVKLYDSRAQAGRQNRHLANNMQGQAITSIEGDFANEAAVTAAFGRATAGNVNDMRAQHFFHFDGQYLGSFGQLNSTSASSPSNEFKANFDVNYTPVSGQYPPASTSDIVVQEGDTLRKVAARIFGDPGLWYLLAEENGLTDPDAALPPGSTLRVPTSVYSLSNTSDVFKPFSLEDAIGDKQASFIDTTPPKPDMRCGKLGQIILTIIAIVVTIIVSYYLGPMFSGPMGAFFVGVISGMAGSAVSQGVGIATGLQESFNWDAVAMAGIAGGVGASVAPAVSGMGITNPLANGLVSGALGSAITQGASMALGLQKSFSWRDVALSAAAGAASAQMGKWTSSGANAGKSFAGDFGRGIASGLAELRRARHFRRQVRCDQHRDGCLRHGARQQHRQEPSWADEACRRGRGPQACRNGGCRR